MIDLRQAPRLFLDACVLYPTVMREVLIGLAGAGFYRPRWSDRVLEEWRRAAAKLGPEGELVAGGEAARIQADWPDATVTRGVALEARLWLPDPADVHVLASAIGGSCDGIVTLNAKDFPRNILAEEGLLRLDPDALAVAAFEIEPTTAARVAEAVRAEASRLSGADWEIRKLMRKARLPRFGKVLSLAAGGD